jgi:predicted amidophosphoribosyltransferase
LNACPECGGSLIAQCPNCSAFLRHKGGFCHECAQPLKQPAE